MYILYLFNQIAFSFSTAHSPQQLFHSSQPTAVFSHSHSSTKQDLSGPASMGAHMSLSRSEAPPRTIHASSPYLQGQEPPHRRLPKLVRSMSDCPKPHLSIFLLKNNKHLSSTTRAEYCYLDPFQKLLLFY